MNRHIALVNDHRWIDPLDPVTYARVDLVHINSGPLVMELELIEPELFFRHAPGAARRLARSLDSLLVDSGDVLGDKSAEYRPAQ